MSDIWAIILAAGESKRMGSPKMLLAFKGTTMIENVIANVSKSKIDRILVVLGANFKLLLDLVKTKEVNYCYNENYRDGMLSSVICGFRNIPIVHRAVLVFQGDQPLISPFAVNSVIDSYISSGKGIVLPIYQNRRGHPILIDRKYRNEIEKLDPAEGLRSLLTKFPEDVLEVKTEDSGILRDFDTYDEYKEGINQIQ
jgi:molybdenum cofactor cytidylyltransferase